MLASLSPSQGLLVRAPAAPRLRQLLLLQGGAQPAAAVVEENSSAPAYYQLQIDANEDEVCAVTRLTAVGYADAEQSGTGGIPMNWWVKNCGD